MALGDLFKSKKDREKEDQRKRRKAFREAESAVDVVKERVGKFKKERDKAWAEARQYLKDGQKGAAQRCLQTCRAAEMMGAKLEMKRWVFEQLLTKLDLAKTDQEFTASMAAINTVVKIDPEAVADVMGEIEDKLGDQVDTDKILGEDAWQGDGRRGVADDGCGPVHGRHDGPTSGRSRRGYHGRSTSQVEGQGSRCPTPHYQGYGWQPGRADQRWPEAHS